MSGRKKEFALRDDLAGPELAITKEQHDRMVDARGRNYTDGPIGNRYIRDSRPPVPDNPIDENARRIREDGT